VTRRAPRQVRMFSTKTIVEFDRDRANQRTIMELDARDRPGLLSIVGEAFNEFGVNIETAKILTIGERAEDVFFVVDDSGRPLDQDTCERLGEYLAERLGSNS